MSRENDHLKEVIKEKCQPSKERKIGVSWNVHCSEICISNVVWQLIILTRTRSGGLLFRPCSTFPLPDIAKITNRTRKENKKLVNFQSELWTRSAHAVDQRYQLHCENAYLSCTGYSKEKPLWKPGISHLSGYLMSYIPQITSDYKREAKNKEARQRIRGERKGIFGGYFHLYCKTLYNYSDTF